MSVLKNSTLVLKISAIISIIIAVVGIVWTETFTSIASSLMTKLETNFYWLYLYAVLFFVIFLFVIAISPWGKIRLGKDDDRPEYSAFSWFAMLFAAGMGIGLVFWGVSEPLTHYISPMAGYEPQTAEAARFSIRSCFMHWGLHPWACYAILGLSLGYMEFRKGEKVLVSNLLKPLLGEKIAKGPLGVVVDALTTIITVIGVATSFGMGCIQVSAGLHYKLGIPDNTIVWLIIIVIVTICFMTSAIKGLDKGIKFLSNLNMFLCGALILLAIIVGPKMEIITNFFVGIRDYAVYFFSDSVRTAADNGDTSWIFGWRVFYWAWWVSWVPFVGAFVARISKGRTIREFIFGSTLVPMILSCIWFAVFGSVGMKATENLSVDTLSGIIASPQTAIYYVFNQYSGGIFLSVIAMVLCILFYITSADSATFVLGMLTSDGDPNPSNKLKVFWGILIAIVAYALIVSGGVSSIQNISIVIALPYLILMLMICASIVKALMDDKK